MKICIDFDGTCVFHKYPLVGGDVPGAQVVLKQLVDNGHQIILDTMRSDVHLKNAIDWFKERDIPLYGIQRDPEQITWTNSPKCYGKLSIDDRNLGCPLRMPISSDERPYVDWFKVRELCVEKGLIGD